MIATPMVMKAKYGTDLRKVQLYQGQCFGFEELAKRIKGMFTINSTEAILLKYRDEEGDFITLTDDDDLALALRTEPYLYVEVNVLNQCAALSSGGQDSTVQSASHASIKSYVKDEFHAMSLHPSQQQLHQQSLLQSLDTVPGQQPSFTPPTPTFQPYQPSYGPPVSTNVGHTAGGNPFNQCAALSLGGQDSSVQSASHAPIKSYVKDGFHAMSLHPSQQQLHQQSLLQSLDTVPGQQPSYTPPTPTFQPYQPSYGPPVSTNVGHTAGGNPFNQCAALSSGGQDLTMQSASHAPIKSYVKDGFHAMSLQPSQQQPHQQSLLQSLDTVPGQQPSYTPPTPTFQPYQPSYGPPVSTNVGNTAAGNPFSRMGLGRSDIARY